MLLEKVQRILVGIIFNRKYNDFAWLRSDYKKRSIYIVRRKLDIYHFRDESKLLTDENLTCLRPPGTSMIYLSNKMSVCNFRVLNLAAHST